MVALVALLLVCLGCSSGTGDGEEGARTGGRSGPTLEGCGPLTFDEARGRAPAYLAPPLDR